MEHNIIENKLLYNPEYITNGKPLTADIFLTNFCNNKCPYCTYARYDERRGKGEFLSFEDFVKYAKRLLDLGVKGFILTGGGEPTINPDFDKITKWLEDNGVKYGINTNFNKLKYIKPAYLKVSLDAWDNDSYKAKRGVSKYDTAIENIKAYRKWQKENGVKTTLGIQVLVETMDDINKFYEANKALDVDYIVFRPVESKQGQYYENHSYAEFVERLEELAKQDERITVNFKWYRLGIGFDKCYAQAAQIAMDWRGNIMYCCHKPYDKVCHVMDDNVLEKKAEHKTNMSMCDMPCRLTGANIFLKKIQDGCKDSEFI